MDWLLTIELEEEVIEKIDATAKRLNKSRIEVTHVIISHILENLQTQKDNEEFEHQYRLFDKSKIDIEQ